ncbi:hypothetical protein D3C75_813760 [compost metagenome]
MIEEGLPRHLQALDARPGRRVTVTLLHALHIAVQFGQPHLVAQFGYRQQQGRADGQHAGKH